LEHNPLQKEDLLLLPKFSLPGILKSMKLFLRKLIRPFLFLVLIALAIYGAFSVWGSSKLRSLRASIFSSTQNDAPESFAASFLHDDDNDGLSNAKELIYGTNVNKTDSDNDGYKDGDEVQNGYDPSLTGKARVEENIKLSSNLTVQYFSWVMARTGDKDPRLEEKQITKFLEDKKMDTLTLPEISDRDINISANRGAEGVKNYLNDFSNIKLPSETGSYLDVAQNVIQQQRKDVVESIIGGIAETEQHVRNLQTPAEAVELHKGYLALFKGLHNLFADLYEIDRDPVKLMRDVKWGSDLIAEGTRLERIRLGLVAKYNPAPVIEPSTPEQPEEPQQ